MVTLTPALSHRGRGGPSTGSGRTGEWGLFCGLRMNGGAPHPHSSPLPSREKWSFDRLRTTGGAWSPSPQPSPIEGEGVLRQAQDEGGAPPSPLPSPIKGEGVLRQAQDERGSGGTERGVEGDLGETCNSRVVRRRVGMDYICSNRGLSRVVRHTGCRVQKDGSHLFRPQIQQDSSDCRVDGAVGNTDAGIGWRGVQRTGRHITGPRRCTWGDRRDRLGYFRGARFCRRADRSVRGFAGGVPGRV